MQKINLQARIEKLIPSTVPELKPLQFFFMDLLHKVPEVLNDADLNSFDFPAWERSTLSKEQLLEALNYIEQNGKLKDWYVPAYLASLAYTIDTKNEKIAFRWASANTYIILQLVDKHELNIKMLCLRFRVAHPLESDHAWIWDKLPKLPVGISSIVETLKTLQSEYKDAEEKSTLKKSSVESSERVAEIRRPYETKDKINRRAKKTQKPASQGNTSTKVEETVKILMQDSYTQKQPVRINYHNEEGFLPMDELLFQKLNPIKGISYAEQLADHRTERYVDKHYESEHGTANSANMQGAVLDQQIAHIQRNSFEFPTNPKVLLLSQIQILFAVLWKSINEKNSGSKYNRDKAYVENSQRQIMDACLLLSLMTASPAEIFLDTELLKFEEKIKVDKKRNDQPFWYPKLDITELKIEIDAGVEIEIQKNKFLSFALPLPNKPIDILTTGILRKENFPSKENINSRVFELRKELKLPILSPDRIKSALHGHIRRYADDHYFADLLCSVSPHHSPGLFYGSFNMPRIEKAYGHAISQFSEKSENFDDAYLAPEFKLVNGGSQITPTDTLVTNFFDQLSLLLHSEADSVKQFNLYSFWMWHIFMLLTSCRPVDHMPGMHNQIVKRAKLIWISDKEGRLTSSSGRFIPLCSFLENALDDYVEYLQSYARKYGATDAATDSALKGILNCELPILHIYQNKRWKPLTPKLVLGFVKEIFPFPLNWPRHFGRYYLYEKGVDINLIDAIFGHEAPSHEALNPYSSSSLSELIAVGSVYDQMAEDLQLERVQVHVV